MLETENKPKYEMPYLLIPEIAEDKVDSEVNELKKIIAENGGVTIQTGLLEKKRLAYPVKKQNWAYFGVVYFNVDNKDDLNKVKKIFASNKKILRFLILNKAIKTHPTGDHPKGKKPNPIISKEPAPMPSFDQKLESILKG